MITDYDYFNFGNLLVQDVLNKLTGSHKDYERVYWNRQPHFSLLVGNLAGINEEKIQFDDSKPLNTISVKFLLENFEDVIQGHLDFYLYYRIIPTYEEQKKHMIKTKSDKIYFVPFWKRIEVPIDFKMDQYSEEFNIDFKDTLNKIINDKELLRSNIKFDKSILENKEDYEALVEKVQKLDVNVPFDWKCDLKFNNREFIQNNCTYTLVDISLENNTPIIDDKLFEYSIFNPIFKISLGNNVLHEFNYKYAENETYGSPLRCINCQGDFDRELNMITTKNYGIYNQPKITPVDSLDGVDISFKTLATPKGIDELEEIYEIMNEFYDNSSPESEGYKDFYDMKERFRENIDLIKSDEKVSRAFYLMNETFKLNSEGKYTSWRLFQIVFIVSQLKDIVKGSDRDKCELLHVMTGGGKSETYFGIVIFTAFYDRLNGKKFGVSAITKFPLRMLSIQQLERIANVFIHAEQLRKREKLGGEPFSIAYFVGSEEGEFPAKNRKILRDIEQAKDNDEHIKGKIIDTCPLCEKEVYLDIDDDKRLVIHKCSGCSEEFRLYYSDDEIYRTLPTFIIGTVDKWAGIALNRRFRNLLGGELDECLKHGFIPATDKCTYEVDYRRECRSLGNPVEKNFDSGPTLVIQDEMHLIKEGFGTIDSHFESLIESMKSEFSDGVKFKNIAISIF